MNKLLCAFLILAGVIAGAAMSIYADSTSATVYLRVKVVGDNAEKIIPAKDIIKALKEHVDKVTSENGGYYPIYEAKTGRKMLLKLREIDEEHVSYLRDDRTYFACAELATDGGTISKNGDFCIWFEQPEKGALRIDKAEFIPKTK